MSMCLHVSVLFMYNHMHVYLKVWAGVCMCVCFHLYARFMQTIIIMHVYVKVFAGMRDCVCVFENVCARGWYLSTSAGVCICVCMCMYGICVRNYVNEPVQYIYNYKKVGLIFS